MDLYIYSPELELCGVVDNLITLNWYRKFFESGGFKVTAPGTGENLRLLRKHMLVDRGDGEVGVITEVARECNEKGENITASGTLLTGVLANRVLLDSDADFMTLLDKNVGAAADEARRIPKLYVDASEAVDSDYQEEHEFSNLGEYAKMVCEKNGFGLRVLLEHGAERRLKLQIARGVDRSLEQSDNLRVIFSDDFDNLMAAKYQYSEKGAASTVYGYAVIPPNTRREDDEQIIRCAGDDKAGYERIETAKSVRAETMVSWVKVLVGYDEDDDFPLFDFERATIVNMSKTIAAIDNVTNGTISPPTENYTGSVCFESGYKSDFDLGDIVTVYHKRWGVTVSNRICEINEHYEKGGVKVTPVFGSPLPSAADILKTKTNN